MGQVLVSVLAPEPVKQAASKADEWSSESPRFTFVSKAIDDYLRTVNDIQAQALAIREQHLDPVERRLRMRAR